MFTFFSKAIGIRVRNASSTNDAAARPKLDETIKPKKTKSKRSHQTNVTKGNAPRWAFDQTFRISNFHRDLVSFFSHVVFCETGQCNHSNSQAKKFI